MNGQLPEKDKSVLIGDRGIERIQFDQRSLHEIDQRQGGRRGELAVLQIVQIHFLVEGTTVKK